MEKWIWIFWIGLEGMEDLRDRQVYAKLLWGGVLSGIPMLLREQIVWGGEEPFSLLLIRIAERFGPGLLLLLFAGILRETVGEGDLWTLLGSGCYLKGEEIWWVFGLSMGFALLWALGATFADRKEKGIPYLACLFAAGFCLLVKNGLPLR